MRKGHTFLHLRVVGVVVVVVVVAAATIFIIVVVVISIESLKIYIALLLSRALWL